MKARDTETLATELDIILDATQLNIGGERSLMSPHKEVLIGTHAGTGKRVVLKYSLNALGAKEIESEHAIRLALQNVPFAEEELTMPLELFFGIQEGSVASVTAFIEQDKVFTDHTLQEQFFMGLHALESQESFHATTAEHNTSIRNIFTAHTPEFYIHSCTHMKVPIETAFPESRKVLEKGIRLLVEHKQLLEVYDGYLMHTDFVPHNFRIQNRQLYLLDGVSFRLGNKYESWARFINFMEIHNPALVPLFLDYIKVDRGTEEYLVLTMMRVYKIFFLLDYYARTLPKTDGDLHTLTKERLVVWTAILEAVLNNTHTSPDVLIKYYQSRSQLRTEAEKKRQQQFTWT